MITVMVAEILPHAYLLHILLCMLQQTDLHCPVMEHIVTASALYFNFSNSKYSVHKIYILIHFVFTSHWLCLQDFIL
jgi:hypothetical protein